MQILIKLAQLAICAGLMSAAAYSAKAKEPSHPEKDSSRVSGFTHWHDGSTAGAYGIGVGCTLGIIPPTYETFTENVVAWTTPEIISIPATFEWVKEDSEIVKAYPKTVTRSVMIPAQFETIVETVEIQPAKTEYYLVEPVYDSAGSLKTQGTIKAKHVPALMKDVKRSVIKTPARTEERVVPNTPLVRQNGYVRIVKTPSRIINRKLPQHLVPVSRRHVKHPERFFVRCPGGKFGHIFDNFEDFTAFIDSLK